MKKGFLDSLRVPAMFGREGGLQNSHPGQGIGVALIRGVARAQRPRLVADGVIPGRHLCKPERESRRSAQLLSFNKARSLSLDGQLLGGLKSEVQHPLA